MSADNADEQYKGPRANVVETDGTISASVEETNRLRSLLGLKPLRPRGSKEGTREETVVDASKVPESKPSAYEVRRRLDDSRAKRHRDELTEGPSLGEELTAELTATAGATDSAAWVRRLRQKTTKPQEKAARKSARGDQKKALVRTPSMSDDEEISTATRDRDYENGDYEGADLKVDHRAADLSLKAGDEMILTLRDRRLINEEGELCDAEDLLENPDLVAKAKRQKLKSERNRKTTYNPFDEDVDDVIGLTIDKVKKHHEILPHYDEWAKIARRPKGDIDAENAIRLSDITATNQQLEPIPAGVSLTSAVGIQRDFMTPEEADIARKKAIVRAKKEKKGAAANGRKRRMEIDEGPGEEMHEVGSFMERMNPQVNRPPKPLDQIDQGPEDLDDAALYEQLKMRRKLGVDQQKRQQVKEELSITNAVSLVKKHEEATVKEEQMDDAAFASGIQSVGMVDCKPGEFGGRVPSSSGNAALEFTATTEFCRALETPFQRSQNIRPLELAGKQQTAKSKRGIAVATTAKSAESTTAGASPGKAGRRTAGTGNLEGTDSEMTGEPASEEAQEDEALEEDEELTVQEEKAVELLISENLLDGGLASALNMLKSRGELSDDSWRLGRHSGDNRPLHQSADNKDIKIEYKDEFGRVLGPKDAFRYISWAFHGKGPGKKKREKLLRKIETEKKKKDVAQNTNLLPTMQALRKQQKHGQAHIVLSSSSSSSSSRP